MHDTSARLVERVLPVASYRQWVLTVPVPRLRRPGWTLRHRGDPSDSSLRLELGYAFPGCGAPGEFISAAGPAPERGCSPRGQALAGVACRRRQKKYESPQSTPVAAAQPHASGPSPTERWAMSAEPRSMAKPA